MRVPAILVLLGSSAALVSAAPNNAALNGKLYVLGDGPLLRQRQVRGPDRIMVDIPLKARPLLGQRQVAGPDRIIVDGPVLIDADGSEASVADNLAAPNDAFVSDDTASEDITSASSDTALDDSTAASDDTTASDSTDAVQDSGEPQDASADSEP